MTAVPVRRVPAAEVDRPYELHTKGTFATRWPVIVREGKAVVEFPTTQILVSKGYRVQRWERTPEADEIEAVARLFAASAELLAACRLMIDVGFWDEQEDQPLHTALDAIRQAIARVEDRSPIPLIDDPTI